MERAVSTQTAAEGKEVCIRRMTALGQRKEVRMSEDDSEQQLWKSSIVQVTMQTNSLIKCLEDDNNWSQLCVQQQQQRMKQATAFKADGHGGMMYES